LVAYVERATVQLRLKHDARSFKHGVLPKAKRDGGTWGSSMYEVFKKMIHPVTPVLMTF
jgi:hypothetical protein